MNSSTFLALALVGQWPAVAGNDDQLHGPTDAVQSGGPHH